jgi:hypothetical protein
VPATIDAFRTHPARIGVRLLARASTAMKQRSRTVRSIGKHGRRAWHTASGYSRRSRVENINFR